MDRPERFELPSLGPALVTRGEAFSEVSPVGPQVKIVRVLF